MDLINNLENAINPTPAILGDVKKFSGTTKQDRFTITLKKLLNRFDTETVLVKKVVQTALDIEFDNKLEKKELNKMVDVISGIYMENDVLRNELVAIAKSIIKANDDQKIVIH